MSEALKVLNNIRTLRAQAREYSVEILEEMLEKLDVVVKSAAKKSLIFRQKMKNARVNLISIVKCYWLMVLTRMN